MDINTFKKLAYIPLDFDALAKSKLDDHTLKIIINYYEKAIETTRATIELYEHLELDRVDYYKNHLEVITRELETLQIL